MDDRCDMCDRCVCDREDACYTWVWVEEPLELLDDDSVSQMARLAMPKIIIGMMITCAMS